MAKNEANIIFTNTLLKVTCKNCGHVIPSLKTGHIEPDYKKPSRKETVIVNGQKVKIGAVDEVIVVSPEACPGCRRPIVSLWTERMLTSKKTKYYVGVMENES